MSKKSIPYNHCIVKQDVIGPLYRRVHTIDMTRDIETFSNHENTISSAHKYEVYYA